MCPVTWLSFIYNAAMQSALTRTHTTSAWKRDGKIHHWVVNAYYRLLCKKERKLYTKQFYYAIIHIHKLKWSFCCQFFNSYAPRCLPLGFNLNWNALLVSSHHHLHFDLHYFIPNSKQIIWSAHRMFDHNSITLEGHRSTDTTSSNSTDYWLCSLWKIQWNASKS